MSLCRRNETRGESDVHVAAQGVRDRAKLFCRACGIGKLLLGDALYLALDRQRYPAHLEAIGDLLERAISGD